ncbi:MAG TPA: hypothetical protein DCR58_02115 [Idiomarina baltica]|uniref:Uncharacterized protein n=2 Tax=Alteromonadales TaxID=135622 RepID=A0A358DZI3_9ALTE|nr:hypothetical protein [Alteromonas australica]HAR55562.1 hypothetical protein [Idiomarina baltica]HBU51333.1 hypothetical protein [Alteromonas australica]|tara:strand:- start:3554 stop:4027 length:474 start_codon:yes stop_codon:yes gene_type:complete
MKVEVYLDKRKMGNSPKRIYSIRKRDAHGCKVLFKSSSIMLSNVTLVVQQAGHADTVERLQANDDIAKRVHAFLRGELVYRGRNADKQRRAHEADLTNPLWRPVGYAPLLTNTWKVLDGYSISAQPNLESQPVISHAPLAFLHTSGILVSGQTGVVL